MSGSNLLLLYEVREAAGEVLGQLIDHHNVLHIKSLASTFSCREVESKARNFLLERFELVSTTPEFLKLGPRELATYLAMDDIIVRSEESIFDCILRWIEVESEQRTRHFDSLVTHVRFALISQHHLDTSIKPRGLVQRSAVCAQLIKEAETLRANQRCGDGAAAALGVGAVPQYRGSNQLLFLQSANLSPWLKNPPVLFDFKKTKWKAVKGPSGVCRYREGSCTVLYCTVLYCTVLYCTVGVCRGQHAAQPQLGGAQRALHQRGEHLRWHGYRAQHAARGGAGDPVQLRRLRGPADLPRPVPGPGSLVRLRPVILIIVLRLQPQLRILLHR